MSDTLRFRRGDLLARLKANREQHSKDYDEAMTAWKKAVLWELTGKVKQCETGDTPHHVPLPAKPEQHLDDYDAYLAMYEMTATEEIELDVALFRQLVLDQWQWARSFASNTKSYLGK